MNKPKAIIFDLDGTLCELNSPLEKYNHSIDDPAISSMKYLYECLANYYSLERVIILTGRKEKEYRDITWKWIEKNLYYMPCKLIMQEWSTAQPNHIFKREALQKLQEEYDIIALIDDNPNLIPVCKDLKILLLQVHNWI